MLIRRDRVLAAACALAGAVALRYRADLAAQRRRIGRGSQVVGSPFGDIEYATAGAGPPVLIAHGAGGGFDQAIGAAERLLAAGFRVIAPSRFGYLRSHVPAAPTLDDQAGAYAFLLDRLGIREVAVIGVSVGALSALQFAVRHPRRCGSLTLVVPAASSAGAPQGRLPAQGALSRLVVERLLGSDLLYWLAITVARDRMVLLVLGVDPAIVAAAEPDERRRAVGILRGILPISARAQGLAVDARFATAPQSIALEAIACPTLVVAVADDRYRTLEPAQQIARRIPGARLVTYRHGGHAWVGHDAELFTAFAAFLRACRAPPASG